MDTRPAPSPLRGTLATAHRWLAVPTALCAGLIRCFDCGELVRARPGHPLLCPDCAETRRHQRPYL